MGNEGIFSVGKEFSKTTLLFAKQNVLQDDPSHETLANLIAWHDFSASSRVLHTWPFPRLLLASYSRTALIHFLKLDSSLIFHTHFLQINPHTYKEND